MWECGIAGWLVRGVGECDLHRLTLHIHIHIHIHTFKQTDSHVLHRYGEMSNGADERDAAPLGGMRG
jgi:hypothetical protein